MKFLKYGISVAPRTLRRCCQAEDWKVSSHRVAFLALKIPLFWRLIVNLDYIGRHIDVDANSRQVALNQVKGNCRTERPNIDQRELSCSVPKKSFRKNRY